MESSTDNHSTRAAPLITACAVAAGIAGDYLLRSEPGINVFAWFAVVTVLVVVLVRREHLWLGGEGRWLVVPLMLLALAFAWRNSVLLLLMDWLVLAFTLGVMVVRSKAGRLRLQGVADVLLATASGAFNIIVGPLLLLFGDVSWKELPRKSWSLVALAVVRGLLIAIPLLVLFGALFSVADAVFQQFMDNLFDFDVNEVLTHLFLVGLYAWLAAGITRSLVWGNEPDWAALSPAVSSIKLGTVEMGTVLGSLNALFLTFVIIQFRYLFGGAALVLGTTGLTYAEYARRGFFELVAVAALLLPLLLVAHWLMRHGDARGQGLFRWFAGSLVAMLFVIMGSAFYRMWLYQQEFGLTELRFYVTAFMVWLGAVFVWFIVTVLREHRERFMFGVLVSGYAALLLLHAVNPDAFIARHNLALFAETGHYDAYYNMRLSADAAPVVIEGVGRLDAEGAGVVADSVLRRWSMPAHPDWRSWNLGRWWAWQAVERNRVLLEQLAGPDAETKE